MALDRCFFQIFLYKLWILLNSFTSSDGLKSKIFHMSGSNDCGSQRTVSGAEIYSQYGRGQLYANSVECRLKLTAPQSDWRFQLRVLQLDIPDRSFNRLCNDALYVYDANSVMGHALLAAGGESGLCGKKTPQVMLTSGPYLTLHFRSDSGGPRGKGFKLVVTAFTDDFEKTGTCGDDKFLCLNRKCIDSALLCDGVDHCGDQSDERMTGGANCAYRPQHTDDGNGVETKKDEGLLSRFLSLGVTAAISISVGSIVVMVTCLVCLVCCCCRCLRKRPPAADNSTSGGTPVPPAVTASAPAAAAANVPLNNGATAQPVNQIRQPGVNTYQPVMRPGGGAGGVTAQGYYPMQPVGYYPQRPPLAPAVQYTQQQTPLQQPAPVNGGYPYAPPPGAPYLGAGGGSVVGSATYSPYMQQRSDGAPSYGQQSSHSHSQGTASGYSSSQHHQQQQNAYPPAGGVAMGGAGGGVIGGGVVHPYYRSHTPSSSRSGPPSDVRSDVRSASDRYHSNGAGGGSDTPETNMASPPVLHCQSHTDFAYPPANSAYPPVNSAYPAGDPAYSGPDSVYSADEPAFQADESFPFPVVNTNNPCGEPAYQNAEHALLYSNNGRYNNRAAVSAPRDRVQYAVNSNAESVTLPDKL